MSGSVTSRSVVSTSTKGTSRITVLPPTPRRVRVSRDPRGCCHTHKACMLCSPARHHSIGRTRSQHVRLTRKDTGRGGRRGCVCVCVCVCGGGGGVGRGGVAGGALNRSGGTWVAGAARRPPAKVPQMARRARLMYLSWGTPLGLVSLLTGWFGQ